MGGKKSEIDTEEVKKIIKTLRKDLEKLEGGYGTPFELERDGNITAQDLGMYPAGQVLAKSTNAAYVEVSTQYKQFIQSYHSVIEALERMVGNHDKKEQENATAVYGVMSGRGGSKMGRRNTQEWGGG